MTWAARLAKLSDPESPNPNSSDSSDRGVKGAIGPNGAIGVGVFSEKTPDNDHAIIVPCSRCGAKSRPFLEVINPDLWQCDTCLPADPDDAAYEAIERVAIMAEANPAAPILHHMPVSWSDATITPTPGARCRCCNGNRWWTEAVQPNGWRCSTCHPGNHLSADRRRDVTT
jgi:hypothetical protein